MTSATGDSRVPSNRPRWSVDRQGGFTLVEIIVVMAILVMLFGLVAVSLSAYLGSAARSATIARISKLELFLDQYKSLTGEYPPDGIDSPERTQDGIPLKGSACLYYYLSRPVVVQETIGGRKIPREYPPVGTFKESELSFEDPDYPGVRELLDGWDTPMHYDNTTDGKFISQGGDVHYPPVPESEHPPDPRDMRFVVDGEPVVSKEGVQSRSFDIWSHSEQGHDLELPPSIPIATWNKE
jgi:prepilin-type N-terminal cleavage/methylation domain-containing protein